MVQGDRRCLLEGGGSTDTFFIREDSKAGLVRISTSP
jgi:hypothetical protein